MCVSPPESLLTGLGSQSLPQPSGHLRDVCLLGIRISTSWESGGTEEPLGALRASPVEERGEAVGQAGRLIPTGPRWPLKSRVRLLPSMLAMLMLSPSVQYSFLGEEQGLSILGRPPPPAPSPPLAPD